MTPVSLNSVRKIPPGTDSITGRQILKSGQAIDFESTIERDFQLILDFDPRVLSLCAQPVEIRFRHQGIDRNYVPDLMAVYSDDNQTRWTVLYEVKPLEVLRSNAEEFECKFVAARQYCEAKGWTFAVITEREIRTVRLANAQHLCKWMRVEPDHALQGVMLRSLAVVGPVAFNRLLEATFQDPDARRAAAPQLWRLIGQGHVLTNLDEPLSGDSVIWEGY